MHFEAMSPLSVPRVPVLSLILLLLLAVWCEVSLQNPLQQTEDQTRVNNGQVNETCFTEGQDNSTLIISSSMGASQVAAPSQQSPTEQFNERRRDMHFDNYNVKVDVIDTVATNRSESSSNQSPVQVPVTSSTPRPNGVSSQPPSSSSTTESVPSPSLHNGPDGLAIHPQRINVLAPKLESSGKPACVQSPDDTFCEDINNYPNRSNVRTEIDFTPEQFNDIFGPKEIDGRRTYVDDTDNDEQSVCKKTPRVIYPQMAKNQANQWIYVVNEVEYTQAVVAEICEKPGKPCAHLENLPMGMYSRCKQKYSYKRLLALHPTEKRTYPDAFKFPSCCSCYIKYDDYLGRSNGRKLDGKVDVSAAQGRDSRAMTPATAAPPPADVQGATSDNSAIDILSQAGSETNSTGATPAVTSEPSTAIPAIAPQ